MTDIHEILLHYWGYDAFRPLQEDIIRSVLAGRDTLGIMPTGGGKSLTFQVPTLSRPGICLVVSPLVSLMKDQVDNLRERGIKSAYLYSGMTRSQMIITLENCIFGSYKFLYVSPERLDTELFQAKLQAMQVSLLVVDEAHCISQWGYDFRPSYLKIDTIRTQLPGVPLLALTATATPVVAEDIQRLLRFPTPNLFQKSFARPNLSYQVVRGDDKMQQLLHLLEKHDGSAIVYVRSRKKTYEIAQELSLNGIPTTHYHAGLPAADKEERQQAWRTGKQRVIVATNAFGMGIDKEDVRLVVHYDLPNSPEEYYQEAGRAGRDGKRSYPVALFANSDATKLKKRIQNSFPPRDYIKEIYDHLGSYFQIAVGSGIGGIFEFNIALFCQRYSLPLLPTHHALKLLEHAGYILYDEEPDSRSRLRFLLTREELYRLGELQPGADELVKLLLRSYTGLFADYVVVNEEELARRGNLRKRELYERLVYLSKIRIIDYIPRKRTPLIIYRQSREESRYLCIPRASYEERKERFETRIFAILNYTESSDTCRSVLLLHYFGEEEATPCGVCDVCLRKMQEQAPPTFADTLTYLSQAIENGSNSLSTLIAAREQHQEEIIKALRYLSDEGFLRIEKGKYHKIKNW